ncbi:MAG: PAC2 family protein [Rhodopirellula sp.]|nr:PAC2 family protein [Rhodopirellula sp.]
MTDKHTEYLRIRRCPDLTRATLVLAFTGWMDGGDVSTGTVKRLVDLVEAEPIAEIEPEPFYIYSFPGSMEITALFRPRVDIQDGLIQSIEMPSNTFYAHEPADLVLFIGKEPHLGWKTFGKCVFHMAETLSVRRILFVGSFGGSVPHTREPRLYVSCSDAELLSEMEQYGVRKSSYEGPGSFVSYMMTEAPSLGMEMISLVAEIPGYLHGTNPLSIEAVTRRLSKILKLPLDLNSLRMTSTEWELHVSSVIEKNEELAEKVRELEGAYDNELLNLDSGEV